MEFQSFVNTVSMPCCVISVEKKPEEGTWGEIRILCANTPYKEVMGPAYYDNMPYYELVPRDNKFEGFCYHAAVLGRRMHAYVETRALDSWTDQTLIPLASDDPDKGYCQFIFEFTKEAEPERMAAVSAENASGIIQACIRLMGAADFRESVGEVLGDLLRRTDAWGCRIMLQDQDKKEAILFSNRMREDAWSDYDPEHDVITYELMQSWEKTIGVSNAVIVTDGREMEELARINPAWAESMRGKNVTSLVLNPLRRGSGIIGYLYVVNFDTSRVAEIKELTEMLSYFLGSEISNYLLMHKLDELSRLDALTGLNNRRAMLERIREIGDAEETQCFGIVNIDVNGLKKVNDYEGHEAGDRLLVHTAEMLLKVFYQEDLYRTGGDEFVVIIAGIPEDTFDRKLYKLRRTMHKDPSVRFAIGAAWSDGSENVSDVFRCADERMYSDKRAYYREHGGG